MDCIEYGTVPRQAMDWLASEGYLRDGDCTMVVASGDGAFAGPVSRISRIAVCMDRSRDSLEATRAAVVGGCRTELFEMDWMSYVPSRGGYDSVVMSPSRLCFDAGALERIGTVSKRACAVVVPAVDGYRDALDALARAVGGPACASRDPGVPAGFADALRGRGISPHTASFESWIEPSADDIDRALLRDCGHGIGDAPEPARDIIEGMASGYRCVCDVIAWNVPGAEGVGRAARGHIAGPVR